MNKTMSSMLNSASKSANTQNVPSPDHVQDTSMGGNMAGINKKLDQILSMLNQLFTEDQAEQSTNQPNQ